tara:strand:+ start:870 stop:1160 length:291 start_codon:yes stop_codon:yes gene_type:complete
MENMTETKARFFNEKPKAEMNFEVVQTEYLKWLEDLARKQLAYNDALQLVGKTLPKGVKIKSAETPQGFEFDQIDYDNWLESDIDDLDDFLEKEIC